MIKMIANKNKILLDIKYLSLSNYIETWQAMQHFTMTRTAKTGDAIWLCEHPPVFTQGRHGKAEHILNPHHIPIVPTDRGGQITYHGPGQLIIYFLLDLRRRKMGIRQLVDIIEQSVLSMLTDFGINGRLICGAPGIYVDNDKLCSIGLRVKHGCTYHGLALNIDMDLTPFSYINPCGYEGLDMTQIKILAPIINYTDIETNLLTHLQKRLSKN